MTFHQAISLHFITKICTVIHPTSMVIGTFCSTDFSSILNCYGDCELTRLVDYRVLNLLRASAFSCKRELAGRRTTPVYEMSHRLIS